jgi:hypothetical protein
MIQSCLRPLTALSDFNFRVTSAALLQCLISVSESPPPRYCNVWFMFQSHLRPVTAMSDFCFRVTSAPLTAMSDFCFRVISAPLLQCLISVSESPPPPYCRFARERLRPEGECALGPGQVVHIRHRLHWTVATFWYSSPCNSTCITYLNSKQVRKCAHSLTVLAFSRYLETHKTLRKRIGR